MLNEFITPEQREILDREKQENELLRLENEELEKAIDELDGKSDSALLHIEDIKKLLEYLEIEKSRVPAQTSQIKKEIHDHKKLSLNFAQDFWHDLRLAARILYHMK
jgi:hypothetical protein